MNKIVLALCALACLSCQKKPQVQPAEFPNTGMVGFQFPESQQTIYSWLNKQDTDSITSHAWGIWAGLTWPTDQSYAGQTLLTYQTWMGVADLSDAAAEMDRDAGCRTVHLGTPRMHHPRQFAHGGLTAAPDTNYRIMETVAYSPDAACFATSNLLFNQSALDRFLVAGDIGKIPEFPVRSITTKPTYYVVGEQHGLVRLPSWTTTPNPAKAWKHDAWTTFVYVDLDNRQPTGKALVPVTVENPTPEQIEAATCNATDFIHFRLDQRAADYLNGEQDRGHSQNFEAGDYALLVAMHVTSKEIKNWTWQTFYWAADPANPGLPSSPQDAALMPEAVRGAARHYAVSAAYTMVWPNQPVTGGTDRGATPVIAYNPYLEAGFGPTVFQQPNLFQPDFQYGVQTNCMSCHALATSSGRLGYTTDQYIDMNSTIFNNDVQLDFAWSVQGNLNAGK